MLKLFELLDTCGLKAWPTIANMKMRAQTQKWMGEYIIKQLNVVPELEFWSYNQALDIHRVWKLADKYMMGCFFKHFNPGKEVPQQYFVEKEEEDFLNIHIDLVFLKGAADYLAERILSDYNG